MPRLCAEYQSAIRRVNNLRYLNMEEGKPNQGLERVRYQLRASGVPADARNPLGSGIHSRGYLPHVKREGASYFVTFRLADSLPQEVLLEFKRRQAERLRALPADAKPEAREEIEREFRRQVERYLDRGAGECQLRRSEIAQMAVETLLHFDGHQYVLDEWVVMPNYTLSDILRDRKRRMARQANLMLGRTGESFWQHESYDHWIRKEEEKIRIRRYIRNNPVIARLCRSAEEWPWSSASGRRLPACDTADCQSALHAK